MDPVDSFSLGSTSRHANQHSSRTSYRGTVSPSVVDAMKKVNLQVQGLNRKETPLAPKKSNVTHFTGESPIKLSGHFRSAHASSSEIIPTLESSSLSRSVLGTSTKNFVPSAVFVRSASDEDLRRISRRLEWDDKFTRLSHEAKKAKDDLLSNRIVIPNDNAFIRALERIPGVLSLMVLLGIASPSQITEKVAQDLIDILYYELSDAMEHNKAASRHEGVKILHALTTNAQLKKVWKKIKKNTKISSVLPQFITKYKELLKEGLKNPDSKFSTQMLADDLEKLRLILDPSIRQEIDDAVQQALRSPNQWPKLKGEFVNLQSQFAALNRDDPIRERMGVLCELCFSTESYLKKMKRHLFFFEVPEFVDCFGESKETISQFASQYKKHLEVMQIFFEELLVPARASLGCDEKISQIISKQFNDQMINNIVRSAEHLILWTDSIEGLVEKHYENIKIWWQSIINIRFELFFKPLKERFDFNRALLDFGSLPFQRVLKFPALLARLENQYDQENKKLWQQILRLSKDHKDLNSSWNNLLASLKNFENDKLWEEVATSLQSDLFNSILPLREQFKRNADLWSNIWSSRDFLDKKIHAIQTRKEASKNVSN